MYIHRNTHAQTHVHTYTDTCTHRHMYIHTHKTHTHTCTCTQTHVHTHIHVHTCRPMYRYTHVQYIHRHVQLNMPTQTHTHTPTLLLTHRSGYCTLGGGREHSTHSLLSFDCAQLLSSLTAPSANDRSGLSSEPAQQDGPGGHTCHHHNFHSQLASR
ncbi:unnamed protein product [Staurois parvus]|uniref:Uncharacterized protein n=1 Tax=Staurois parvus TaxID=386267 RepID=A0ABN9CY12_9NEOB|nr:unnamed protein product [Staurois parvus]